MCYHLAPMQFAMVQNWLILQHLQAMCDTYSRRLFGFKIFVFLVWIELGQKVERKSMQAASVIHAHQYIRYNCSCAHMEAFTE